MDKLLTRIEPVDFSTVPESPVQGDLSRAVVTRRILQVQVYARLHAIIAAKQRGFAYGSWAPCWNVLTSSPTAGSPPTT